MCAAINTWRKLPGVDTSDVLAEERKVKQALYSPAEELSTFAEVTMTPAESNSRVPWLHLALILFIASFHDYKQCP